MTNLTAKKIIFEDGSYVENARLWPIIKDENTCQCDIHIEGNFYDNGGKFVGFHSHPGPLGVRSDKPIVVQRFAGNGAHSHYDVISRETGETLWTGEDNAKS